jgi:hypothetical protein
VVPEQLSLLLVVTAALAFVGFVVGITSIHLHPWTQRGEQAMASVSLWAAVGCISAVVCLGAGALIPPS